MNKQTDRRDWTSYPPHTGGYTVGVGYNDEVVETVGPRAKHR